MLSRFRFTYVAMVGVLSLLSVFATIWLMADYTFQVGSQTVVTDFSRGRVLMENAIGDLQGYGREDFSALSNRLLAATKEDCDKYIKLLAVRSRDGRMTGYMVHFGAVEALRRISESEGNEVAYFIALAKTGIGNRLINPLKFITDDDIEPLIIEITPRAP